MVEEELKGGRVNYRKIRWDDSPVWVFSVKINEKSVGCRADGRLEQTRQSPYTRLDLLESRARR